MVIAIFLILVALLLPVLHRVKEKTRRVLCLSNVRQLGMLTILYAKDDSERSLPLDGRNHGNRAFHAQIWRTDVIIELGILTDKEAKQIDSREVPLGEFAQLEVFKCPSRVRSDFHWARVTAHGQPGTGDLGAMYFYLGNGQKSEAKWEQNWQDRPQKLTDDDADEKQIISDSILFYPHAYSPQGPVINWKSSNHLINSSEEVLGANQIFLDGHAKWKDIEEFGDLNAYDNYKAVHGSTTWGQYWW